MDHPSRVRSRADLADSATEVKPWIDQPDWHAIRDFRIWLYTETWFGTPGPGSSMTQRLTATVPEAMGLRLNLEARSAAGAGVRWGEAARVALDLPTAELGDCLATLDPATVARERRPFWMVVGAIGRAKGKPRPGERSTDPLTMGGWRPARSRPVSAARPGG